MAGATPKETVSAMESYCTPKRPEDPASRATRPSMPSATPASTMPRAARSWRPAKDCTMA